MDITCSTLPDMYSNLQKRFPDQMKCVSFNSKTTGVTGGAGISYHSGVPPVLNVVRVAQMLAFCVLFCRLLFDLLSFFL
jgi:hypothetical protein